MRFPQTLQTRFQFADFAAHFPDVSIHFARRHTALGDQSIQNIGRLAGAIGSTTT
jgi:hypothetical protein